MSIGSIVHRAISGAAKGIKSGVSSAYGAVDSAWNQWGRDTYRDALYGGYGVVLREYGKHQGYNSDERQGFGRSLGAGYASTEAAKTVRIAGEDAAKSAAQLSRQQQLSADQARGQIAARVRRSIRPDQPGTKNGTILTSSLGVPGSQSAGSFASLLGL